MTMTPTEEARIIAETEAGIVQWLRELAEDCPPTIDKFIAAAASCIELGWHRKDQTNGRV